MDDGAGEDDITEGLTSSNITEDDIGDDADAVGPEDTGDGEVDNLRVLEALIFASDELLTTAKLKPLIPGNPDAKTLRKMVAEVNAQLSEQGHPFEIIEAGGGYQFRTVASYYPYVRKLYKDRTAKKLSLQALECLAIIAYRQPISKAEVEAIRGVFSDGAMKTLLERKMVDICGRSDKPGRPLLYGTTNYFLRYFGINKVSDLTKIEEFEALARAKMEEMSVEELGEEQIHRDLDDGDISPVGADGNRPVAGGGDEDRH
jgi:segregation and condensation protein B